MSAKSDTKSLALTFCSHYYVGFYYGMNVYAGHYCPDFPASLYSGITREVGAPNCLDGSHIACISLTFTHPSTPTRDRIFLDSKSTPSAIRSPLAADSVRTNYINHAEFAFEIRSSPSSMSGTLVFPGEFREVTTAETGERVGVYIEQSTLEKVGRDQYIVIDGRSYLQLGGDLVENVPFALAQKLMDSTDLIPHAEYVSRIAARPNLSWRASPWGGVFSHFSKLELVLRQNGVDQVVRTYPVLNQQ